MPNSKRHLITHAVIFALLLSLSNFFYQVLNHQDWLVAFERSTFQSFALIAFAIIYRGSKTAS